MPGMATKQDLERLDLTILAVLCQQVADNASVDPVTAEKAWQLKREWVLLVGPPLPNLKEQQQVESKQADLKTRMAELLSTT